VGVKPNPDRQCPAEGRGLRLGAGPRPSFRFRGTWESRETPSLDKAQTDRHRIPLITGLPTGHDGALHRRDGSRTDHTVCAVHGAVRSGATGHDGALCRRDVRVMAERTRPVPPILDATYFSVVLGNLGDRVVRTQDGTDGAQHHGDHARDDLQQLQRSEKLLCHRVSHWRVTTLPA
jgi:hypothetical protein